MNSYGKLALVAILACATVASDELKEWYKNVNDINFVCDQLGEGSEVADDPIFSVVDCDDDGARWDYKYQVS